MEKILFKKRVLKALSVCLLINIVDIIACYYNLLEMYKDEVIDSIAFNRTLVSGDFHSLLQYGVVYMFIYIIYIVYIISYMLQKFAPKGEFLYLYIYSSLNNL